MGISLRDYDEMTPHELNMHIEEYAAAQEGKQQNELALAWINAYLQRVKKMPKLKEITGKQLQKKKMTDEEMLEQIRALNKIFGGKEVIRTKEVGGDEDV